MVIETLQWGLIIGIVHFMVIGACYGNPFVDGRYQNAQKSDPAVRRWPSRPRYLIYQFLGTQVEVFVLTFGFLWLHTHIDLQGYAAALYLGFLFTAIRVYPRFWNMWIQSTYPRNLLTIEVINGTISTLVIVFGLHWLTS